MNFREISIEEARNLPSGHELWVGQTRQTAVKGEKVRAASWILDKDNGGWCLEVGPNNAIPTFNLKLFTPTPDAVPIEPDEAAARMVRGEPVEYYCFDQWRVADPNATWTLAGPMRMYPWRIPAIPQKQRLVIEVDAGVYVPDEFRIIGKENGWSITATVVSRGVE